MLDEGGGGGPGKLRADGEAGCDTGGEAGDEPGGSVSAGGDAGALGKTGGSISAEGEAGAIPSLPKSNTRHILSNWPCI